MVLPIGGGENKTKENMEALYSYVWSWGTEEEYNITFPEWMVVKEYRDPIHPTSLLANFSTVFPEVAILLNSHV